MRAWDVHRRYLNVGFGLLCSLALAASCGPADDDGGGNADGGGGDGGAVAGTIEITPGDTTLTVVDGADVQQGYSVTWRKLDGSTQDVTADSFLAVDDPRLGSFTDQLFTTSGLAGGTGTVTATYRGLQGSASLTVEVENRRVEQGAPSDAPDLFDNATEEATLVPTLVYPTDGTVVPPNLGDFEVHWQDNGGGDLFEVTLSGAHVSLSIYLPGSPNAGNWVAYLPDEWAIAGMSDRGNDMTVTVRAINRADTSKVGTSTPLTVSLTEQDVEGGIYYWASVADNNAPAGIYRHDMSRPGESAEQFYTTGESPDNRCVACHVLSRDGTRMTITYDGGNGAASIVDVGTRTEMLAVDGTFKWNFASYEPDGSRLLTVSNGVMELRDATTGAALSTVTTGGYASHPDFSPTGDKIAYVSVGSPGSDWSFTGGSIVTMTFDPVAGTFGSPTPLVTATGNENNYYPSWSPDGEWIMFNRSTEGSYDAGSAELWVVKADGSVGPVLVSTPNVGTGLTNSWPRWAPFEQELDGETFYWFTFSSKRAFGVRLAAGRPQVWMAPFFPDRVAGGEASAPSFRLPAQEISSNNHIAQWTERVVPVE
jgi:hypothetical protein